MNSSQNRRIENEVVFKQHNDAVKEAIKDMLPGNEDINLTLQFTCECSNEDCRATIAIPVREYEQARSNNRQFIILKNHEQLDIERVVHHDGYSIVEKFVHPPATDGQLNRTR